MRNRTKTIIWLQSLLLVSITCFAQQSSESDSVDTRFLATWNEEAISLHSKLDKKTTRTLQKWQRQEDRIKRKLAKSDSALANSLFSDQIINIEQLQNTTQQYVPKLDTLATALQFLKLNPGNLKHVPALNDKLNAGLTNINQLKEQFSKAEVLKKLLKERKEFLKNHLAKLGFSKELRKLNKELFYYGQQLQEYKALLKDAKKRERKALELLSKSKKFQEFMKKNSQLASLFRMPGDPNDPINIAGLAGLQTRMQVNSLLQQQLQAAGPGGAAQLQQNLQGAQTQLRELKDKLAKLGVSSSDDEIPDFKPNMQRTKSFWKRLQLGTDIQTQKASGYFPVTSDVALSVGYKLSDKNILGIASSFKMGWGTGFRNIRISAQGWSIRSFIDMHLKGSLWLSGGYERNHRPELNNPLAIENYSGWQESGLLGLSKIISLKTKFFKKTKLQLLWDFMSYRQIPLTQPILFRIGYQFK